ncbi:MAG TPA: cation:proton antiporter [Anaerolineales bacterium]|nr:cation:proton antiporter [Anaerolineales bacterium]
MSNFLQLALALAGIIALAKIGGLISIRLGQPSVLGELIVGILLGPTLIDFLHLPLFTSSHLSETIHELAEIGVLLLMFIAGLDLHLEDLTRSFKVSALAGTLGVILPLALGAGLGTLFNMNGQEAFFIGLILAATSVSISAQTLMELKMLRTRVGTSLLGAAVFDDILVILGISIFIAVTSSEPNFLDILWIVVRMALFLGIGTILGMKLLPRLSQRVAGRDIAQGVVSFTFIIVLIYGIAAETLGGMAAITGAFIAGLALTRSPVRERIRNGTSVLAYGVFVPIFFVNVGLAVDARQLFGPVFWLFIGMTVVAVIGKVVGAGAGALWGGLNRMEALQIGVGMMSRGEVGLIVASIGVTQGLVSENTLVAIVGVVIITTLLTPPLLRSLFAKPHPQSQTQIAETSPEGDSK